MTERTVTLLLESRRASLGGREYRATEKWDGDPNVYPLRSLWSQRMLAVHDRETRAGELRRSNIQVVIR